MNEHKRHVFLDYAHMFAAFALTLIAICCVVVTVWLVRSTPNAKLFEADNTVCFSQPLQMQCYHR